MTDDELIAFLRANMHRLGPDEDLSDIVPDSDLPMSWRTIAGLDWRGRDLLRNAAAAKNGKLRRRHSLLVGQLVRRGLLAVISERFPNMILALTDAGRAVLEQLPGEDVDSPLDEANIAANRRLMDCLHIARFGHKIGG